MHKIFRWFLCLLLTGVAEANELDVIGLTPLRALVPSLTGSGVRVAQPEAGVGPATAWQVNPAATAQPASLFTWISSAGNTNVFPNTLGQESGHADQVGDFLYGATNGVAPGVARVDNYDADYFFNNVVPALLTIPARIVNQSFTSSGQNTTVDRNYDRFAANQNTLFASGVGNGGAPNSPSTCFNGLGVGSSSGATSVGPTTDGRCKPDLVAPGSLTSFSVPLVAGSAALLHQAGARGDAGVGTTSTATNARTIKALLLNGAVKPANWTNTPTQPLDYLSGAGVVNVLNSYRQLRGGKHPFTASAPVAIGGAHPPPTNAASLPARRGWAAESISSSATQDAVHHYFLDLRGDSNRVFTLTATLVWNRLFAETAINNLDLFLYDAGTSNLVAVSQSSVDNVEHLFATNLLPRRYDLQVLKHGGPTVPNQNDAYALAFDFGPPLAPRFVEPAWTGSAFRARLVGEPFTSYVILGTGDWAAWSPVMTNSTASLGWFTFTNAPASGTNAQFYRARWVP